jgi:hypothetical protein
MGSADFRPTFPFTRRILAFPVRLLTGGSPAIGIALTQRESLARVLSGAATCDALAGSGGRRGGLTVRSNPDRAPSL